MKYKCIIFDCDGILVDSEAIATQVLIEMAHAVGVSLDMEFAIQEFSGRSLKSSFDYIEEQSAKKLPASFEQEYRNRTFKAFKKDLKPIKGAYELIHRLNIPFCVASSGPKEKIEQNLTTTKLIDKFKGKIFSSYDIKSWKPDPDIFLHAAKEMRFAPNECVVIEDSISGVKAAIRGGFEVYALANEKNKNLLMEEGANVFFEMNSLDKILA